MSLDVVVIRVRYFPAKQPHAPLSIAEVPLLSDWVLPWLIPDLSTRLAARLLRLKPNNFLFQHVFYEIRQTPVFRFRKRN